MNSSMLAGERRFVVRLDKMPCLPEFIDSFWILICGWFERKFRSWFGRLFWGWFFLITGPFLFVCFLYAAVISKLQSPSDNAIIRAVQNDWYYCFLVPLTLPILVVSVYFHWLCMKMFRHS